MQEGESHTFQKLIVSDWISKLLFKNVIWMQNSWASIKYFFILNLVAFFLLDNTDDIWMIQ